MMHYNQTEERQAETLVLVSCAGQKWTVKSEARALYMRSRWFRAAREYAELLCGPGDRWAILSAKHDLLMPDDLVEPYDLCIGDLSRGDKAVFAGTVVAHFSTGGLFCPHPRRVVCLAGRQYAELILPHLKAVGIECETPLAGLGIGEQYARLKTLIGDFQK